MSATLLCIAKAPVPGRSKTRLSPPCTPEQAAELARAALADTLHALRGVPARRRVLVLDGAADAELSDGFEVVAQADGGLGDRLAAAFAGVDGPALLVGMDTPQVTPTLLAHAAAMLELPRVDAVLGPARDGGFWAIGMRRPRPGAFAGVPMSTPYTAIAQRRRLRELGLGWRELAVLRDVDCFEDARAVAALAPDSRFAAALADVESGGVDAAA